MDVAKVIVIAKEIEVLEAALKSKKEELTKVCGGNGSIIKLETPVQKKQKKYKLSYYKKMKKRKLRMLYWNSLSPEVQKAHMEKMRIARGLKGIVQFST